jgi:hypothetical protein
MSVVAQGANNLRVSDFSSWRDRIWYFVNPVDGQNQANSQIDWLIGLGDGEVLTQPQWSTLLGEFRAFTYSIVHSPASGHSVSVGRMKLLGLALEELGVFMAELGLDSLACIDSSTSWEFVEFLEDSYTSRNKVIGRDRKLVHSAMMRILEWMPLIWAQRDAMEELGFSSFSERPFDGKAPFDVVSGDLGLKRTGRLRPIPDHVAFPVMNAAYRMCGVPADDVARLQAATLEELSHDPKGTRKNLPEEYSHARRLIMDFAFSTLPGEVGPWRSEVNEVEPRTLIDGRDVVLEPIQSLRHLVVSITAAACISFQAGTGLRAHEFCSLEDTSGSSEVDPSCLSHRLSKDGRIECFYVKGMTAKGGPRRQVEWLVGSRPAGSKYVPPTVQALRVLKVLLDPWRKLWGKNKLLLSFTNARGLPRSSESIGPMTACRLTYLQKEFVHECVDLSHLSPAMADEFVLRKALRAHRWRTTFALNLYSFSPSLISGLRDHFKHMNDAVTLTGYIGTDASLIEVCDSTRTLVNARLLIAFSNGEIPIMGSMSKLVEKYGPTLKAAIDAMAGETLEERAVEFVFEQDLQIWGWDYGRCFLSFLPQHSACHDKKGTPSFLRTAPALDFRSPDTCSGCQCFAILPEHLPAWRNRLAKSTAILEAARQVGEEELKKLRVEAIRKTRAERIVAGLLRKVGGEA